MEQVITSVTIIPVDVRSGAKIDTKLWCSFLDHSISMMYKLDSLLQNAILGNQDEVLFICDELQLTISDSCIRNFVMSRASGSEYVRERLQHYSEGVEDLAEMVRVIAELYVPLNTKEMDTLVETATLVMKELVFILGIGFDLVNPLKSNYEVNEVVLTVCNNSLVMLQQICVAYHKIWTKYRPQFPSLELSEDQLDLLYTALGDTAYEVVENIDDLTMDEAQQLIAGTMSVEQLLEGRD